MQALSSQGVDTVIKMTEDLGMSLIDLFIEYDVYVLTMKARLDVLSSMKELRLNVNTAYIPRINFHINTTKQLIKEHESYREAIREKILNQNHDFVAAAVDIEEARERAYDRFVTRMLNLVF